MKHFGFIALVYILQLILFSFACHEYAIKVVSLKNGSHNNIKIDKNYQFELTDDCRVLAGFCLLVDRPFNSALISVKGKGAFMDLFKIKKENYCKFLTDYNFCDFECPIKKTGRICLELKERINLSKYGPYLGFFAGNSTALLRIDYDDKKKPDIYSVSVNIKPKER